MKYIKKYKYFFIALVLVLAIIPLQAHGSNDTFDIVGWQEEDGHDAVISVKVNGTDLSEYNASMLDSLPAVNRVSGSPEETLNVEITLEDGYTLSSVADNCVLFLSGVQSGSESVTNSSSASSIQLPSAEWLKKDQELYLSFRTERQPQSEGSGMTTIDDIVVNAEKIDCAAEINEDFSPDISIPSGKGYKIVAGSICPVEKEGSTYIENISPYTAGSKGSAVFRLDIEDRGPYVFSEDLGKDDITVNNGKLLDYELITSGGPDPKKTSHELCLTISIDAPHSWGKWVSAGSTKHKRVCKNNSSHVQTENHSWDAGKVTTEATCTKAGVRTFTCTVCKGTKTKSIPKLDKTLLVKMKTKGTRGFVISWNKISGAKGYDVFFKKCDGNENGNLKKVKTIKGNTKFSWTKKGLKKHTTYKTLVKAWKMKDGKKTYVRESLQIHAFTTGGSKIYTNPKSVTVNKTSVSLAKGKTFRIKAQVVKLDKKKKLIPKSHAEKLRYLSSDKEIATVNKSGRITAVGKGSCKIYVVSVNGMRKTVSVTVK